MSTPMTPRKRLQLHLDVTDEAQAAELNAAWKEIISGKKPRLTTAAGNSEAIMERTRLALQRVEFPFDLTDLRPLDAALANACIDYLNYDRLGKAEVHIHLRGRGRQMQQFLAEQRVRPQPHRSEKDGHEHRLWAVAQRLGREPDELIREALADVLSRYESKVLGALLATHTSRDADRPLVHTHLLSDSAAKPLCGASDGPWTARPFEFLRLTCRDCVELGLDRDDNRT